MTSATAQPPGRPALDTAELFEPDRRDWLRLVGGLLLAAGAIVLYIRKFEAWGEFLKLLVVLVPFVVLYGLGFVAGLRRRAGDAAHSERAAPGDGAARAEGWQTTFLILGTILSGFVMAQVLLTLGADDLEARLHQVLLGLTVAGAAYAASFLRRVPFLSLIGGLAALWAWLFLWDKIFGGIDSINTGRALLLMFAALVLAAGIALHKADRPQAADFVAVAGVTAILAGLLSVSDLANQFNPVGGDESTKPTEVWNVFILVVALALLAYGSRAATRGPSYVGALGMLAFVGLAGANVVALFNGNTDDREQLVGWPLLLLFLGVAALAASFLLPREGAGGRTPTTTPGGVPGAPRPGSDFGPGAGPYGTQPGQGGYPQQQQPYPPPPQQHQWQPPAQQPPGGGETVARPVPPPPPGQQPPG